MRKFVRKIIYQCHCMDIIFNIKNKKQIPDGVLCSICNTEAKLISDKKVSL